MDTPRQRTAARVRQAARPLGPFDYAGTAALLGVYVIGTSMDEGPKTSLDFYRSAATVIPTLLITVAIQGRLFELSRKVSFRMRYLALTGGGQSESSPDAGRAETDESESQER